MSKSVKKAETFWQQLKPTDKKYTKTFKKSGFSGTDVNPVSRYQRMTEVFGTEGWETTEPVFTIEGKMVYCTVGVRVHTEKRTVTHYGAGGERLFTMIKGGGDGNQDDEAFKKALTDAVGNALVKFGSSADIWLKEFDTKYSNPATQTTPTPAPAKPKVSTPKKEELKLNSEKFNKAVDYLAGGGEMDKIKKTYLVSSVVETALVGEVTQRELNQENQ